MTLTIKEMTNIFKLNSPAEIIEKLNRLNQRRNFPKTETFPFDELYKDTVTKIKTTELSAECILYNSVEAHRDTTEFRKSDHWKELCKQEEIKSWWIFGQNGQGDWWLFDTNGKVYFYDHNQEEMCAENFVGLGIDFAKWIQFADLNKQCEELYYSNEKEYFVDSLLKSAFAEDYKERLKEISLELLQHYPFEI